jgi:hypothetical protein
MVMDNHNFNSNIIYEWATFDSCVALLNYHAEDMKWVES